VGEDVRDVCEEQRKGSRYEEGQEVVSSRTMSKIQQSDNANGVKEIGFVPSVYGFSTRLFLLATLDRFYGYGVSIHCAKTIMEKMPLISQRHTALSVIFLSLVF